MSHNPSFGPAAQTPAQRAAVLTRMCQALPRLRKRLTPHAQHLYARYVAGELDWLQVHAALTTCPSAQPGNSRRA